jgi:hypothetical protein
MYTVMCPLHTDIDISRDKLRHSGNHILYSDKQEILLSIAVNVISCLRCSRALSFNIIVRDSVDIILVCFVCGLASLVR